VFGQGGDALLKPLDGRLGRRFSGGVEAGQSLPQRGQLGGEMMGLEIARGGRLRYLNDQIAPDDDRDIADGHAAGKLAGAGVDGHQERLQCRAPFGFAQFAGDGLLGQGNRLLVVVDLVEQFKRSAAGVFGFSFLKNV
jgi:hypothetical protein